MTQSLLPLFLRDLDKLEGEIKQYPSEESLWRLDGEILNSGGTLALHLAGNLQHFFGILGKTGYQRDRPYEFSARNVPKAKLLDEIGKARKVVHDVLSNLTEKELKAPYPGQSPFETTTEQFLIHLFGHLSWHLGHINYHRRILGHE